MEKIDIDTKKDIPSIIEFLETLGFQGISDPTSTNQIYTKNGQSIVIREEKQLIPER